MQVTGILQSIPEDIYEAAKVDGAGPVKIFFKITLPYMLFVTAPYLITTFAGNINNFNGKRNTDPDIDHDNHDTGNGCIAPERNCIVDDMMIQ